MIRSYTLLLFLFSLSLSLTAQISIEEARNTSLGTEVTVQGIVTTGDELGVIRYMQDETAGIAVYPGNGSVDGFEVVKAGDEILVSGVLIDFNGLLEISPVTGFSIVSTDNALPEPLAINPDDLGESIEGQLVRIECSVFQTSANSFSGNQLYNLNHYTGSTFTLYLGNNHPLEGSAIPNEGVDLVGIASAFNDPQLLVRSASDLQSGPCFFILDGPKATEITNSSFRVEWTTNEPSNTIVRYGIDPGQLTELQGATNTVDHAITIEGLEPATFYWLEAVSVQNGVEAKSPLRPFTTASNSSGDIQVYFNQSTNPDVSDGTFPAASSFEDTEDALKDRIDAATETIDVMMYNTSRDWLVDALEDAVDRGVRVRYIADDQTTNSALSGSIDFPVLEGNDGNALMHNKVFIIDAASVDQSYLIMGSMNMTYNNVITDPNNTVFIQDQAIAKAYTWEFNEMWGSETETPNLALSRFGVDKTHNTPIYFNVAGTPVELYFAPTDPTSDAILENLASADDEAILALLLLTQNRIGDLLVDLHDAGIRIRGLIENISDPGSEFFYLQSEGVNVQAHDELTQFHHKYAIVDADLPSSDPLVITGSYNWTNAAETRNDENTLVIHDADIANQFLQEFSARWGESTAVIETLAGVSGWEVSPNPSTGIFQFNRSEKSFTGQVQVFDLLGKVYEVQQFENAYSWTLDATNWNPGMYYMLWQSSGSEHWIQKISVVR